MQALHDRLQQRRLKLIDVRRQTECRRCPLRFVVVLYSTGLYIMSINSLEYLQAFIYVVCSSSGKPSLRDCRTVLP